MYGMRFTAAMTLLALLLGSWVTTGCQLNAQEVGRAKAGGAKAGRTARKPGQKYPPVLEGAHTEVYKTVGDVKLNMYLYFPKDHVLAHEGRGGFKRRPAIVFFFGGGWRGGSPTQFMHHCQYLASRGMVAMTADYRVASRHNVKAVDCVRDAKSAVRWVRHNSERLGIDANRIVAAGGSAGGHLAACTGVIDGFEEATEQPSVSSCPNAMALFNPAVVLAPISGKFEGDSRKLKDLGDRMGVKPEQLSPYHHIRKGAPPSIVFHGVADVTVPFETAKLFANRMKEVGNRCELNSYPGRGHGFFNYSAKDNQPYHSTLSQLDAFLVSLGYLAAETESKK